MVTHGGEEIRRLGVYWRRDQWDLARAAYLSDFDRDPGAPASFGEWLARAVQAHIDRSPDQRQELWDGAVTDLARLQHGSGFSRAHPLPMRMLDQLEDAVADDRLDGGRAVSRSGFVLEAAAVAVAEATTRRGSPLPPAPQRLPLRPRRRRTGPDRASGSGRSGA